MAQAEHHLLGGGQRVDYLHYVSEGIAVNALLRHSLHGRKLQGHGLPAAAQAVNAEVAHEDSGQRSHRAAQLFSHAPQLQQRVLHGVLAILGIAEQGGGRLKQHGAHGLGLALKVLFCHVMRLQPVKRLMDLELV